MKKKKIMHLTQSIGGVSKYLELLLKYTDTSKYEQILIYPSSNIKDKWRFEKIVDNIEFVDMTREINLISDIKAILEINKLIKLYNPDLIYVHSSKGGALGRIASFNTKTPVIYNPHGWAFNMNVNKVNKILYTSIERILANRTECIIAISEQEKVSALRSKICEEKKIKVIFNGIDIDEYDDMKINTYKSRKKYHIPIDAIVFGMVGRISKQKSPDIFIKSASKIKENISNAFFIIVGDGEDRNEIERMIDEIGLSGSVLITGWVDNIYEYIAMFDIAMLLSRWEGFGLAIAEYMISKKPIIATNVDAIPNLIDNNISGVLINPDDINACVESAISLSSNLELRQCLSENANKKVREKFDIKRVIKEHDQIFDQILKYSTD